jgi:two-component system, cell cycle sensor histidine kinase and response regulator CckA
MNNIESPRAISETLRDSQRTPERRVPRKPAEPSERSQAEEALRQSEERYRDLFENANDIIYTHNLNGCFTSINKRGEMLTGYRRDELLGMNIGSIVAPEYLALISDCASSEITGGKEAKLYDIEIITKDRRRLPVEVNARLIYEGGRPAGIQGIARDISERQQLEEQLRHSQKMEAIGRLAGGIAHDFNNLLTAIIGYSQLVLGRMAANDPMRKEIEEISNAGTRAAALTNQLLAFSRKQVSQPIMFDLNNTVTGLQEMLERLLGEDVHLSIRLAPDPVEVKADPGYIEQVVMNLVINARDAMHKGGILTIETADIEVKAESGHDPQVQPGSYVTLSISDTGSGMDSETMSHIFEPFFTTKEQGKGTGLGLSTVYGIVKQSGGHISVFSQKGLGTTFKVWFPRAADGTEILPQEQPSSLPRGTEAALLLEG